MDINKIREDYPILQREVSGRPLVYLDNAATSQTPRPVVEAIDQMYYHYKANVHRGVHTLSQEATDLVELTREKVRAFINAGSIQEVIFTRGTTEGINLVASSFGQMLENGDEIIVTVMEHHSNIVPWQLIGQRKRVTLRVVPIDDSGQVDMEAYEDLFSDNTRFVALAHVSNVLGTVNPVKEMIAIAHRHGVPVLIDGAQAAPHVRVDVQDIDTVLRSRHPKFGFSFARFHFDDGGNILGGPGRLRIVQIDVVEGVVVRIEGLQAHRRTYPQDTPAVFPDSQDQVARQGVRPVPVEPECREIHPVEAREPVFGADPYEPPGILVDVVDLGVGQAGFGRVEPGHLAAEGKHDQEKGQDRKDVSLHGWFQN